VETPEHVNEVAIVGGNLALDFANTGGPGHGTEALRGYPDVVAWAAHADALTDADADRLMRRARRDPKRAELEYRRGVRLRDSLGLLFGSIAAGESPDATALQTLKREEAEALGHAQLVRAGTRYAWTWGGEADLALPTWLVAHAASELMTQGPLDRVKRCMGCPFVFLDESRNRSRRWCSMDDCGTQEKVRRFVTRRAQARAR
jgi:predicted RNA-binding Zn ribbon-like protein